MKSRWHRYLLLCWWHYKSALVVMLPLPVLLGVLAGNNLLPTFAESMLLYGSCAAVLYKEVFKKRDLVFYYNNGVDRWGLYGFILVIHFIIYITIKLLV